jgi:hypothetical protein
MLTGVSGGTTSVDPSRSLDSEVSPVRASGHKRAEYASWGGGLRNIGCDSGDAVPTIVWSVVPPVRVHSRAA